MTTPRITARARLTALYAGLILISGTAIATLIIVLSFTPITVSSSNFKDTGALPAGKPTVAADQAREQEALDAKQQARAEMRSRLIGGASIGIGGLTLISAGLGWWLAGRVLRPVHVVSQTARELSEQNLHERIPVSGPHDEMRELAETFNAMLARLQRSFDAQSHFAANASHELRGPMTTQRTLVEVAASTPGASPDVRELAQALHPVLDRQERLVDGLLALAWSTNGATSVEPVDLPELVDRALARIGETTVSIHTRLSSATIAGDPVLLDLLVDNLIRNAIRHNIDGGQVWIWTKERSLVVENTGEFLTPERLGSLTEPFRRGAQDRVPHTDGVGLGLAIVVAVANAHHAQLDLVSRPAGGIQATVSFPS